MILDKCLDIQQIGDEQTWKKLIFVHKQIFVVKKCPQIQIVPKHIKVPDISIFHHIRYFLIKID